MNREDLYEFVKDFRRLRSEMMERSNSILALFETALKRSAILETPSEQHFNYLNFGIRITEGDYLASIDSSEPVSQFSLFSEGDKRATARSVDTSLQGDLDKFEVSSVQRSRMSGMHRRFYKKGSSSIKGSVSLGRPASTRREPTLASVQQLEQAEPAMLSSSQLNYRHPMNDAYKHAPSNAPNAPKTGLPIVSETTTHNTLEPVHVVNSTQESSTILIEPPVPSSKQEGFSPVVVNIEFDSFVVPRFLQSASSSTRANTSEIVLLSPELAVASLSTVKSEVRRQPSLTPANSRKRTKRQKNAPPSIFNESQKKITQASLLLSSASPDPSRKPSATAETPNFQTPTFFESFFLFPAYDHKGRRISVESLAAFGKIEASFRVNGLHPRSLFSNLWDLSFGTYNPIYNLCSINLLAASICIIFLCDSIVSLATPLLVNGDFSFDLGEYEKARPTLAVWLVYWMKSKFLINLLAIFPFPIFFRSQLHNEFLLFVSLLRGSKAWHSFCRCPSIVYAAWRLDEIAGTSLSRIVPLTGGILWFIHCNSCTIFIMGSLTGFAGWNTMWPLVDSATPFETYVWTFYKATGNMFPTSYNPWTATEQIVSFVYIILAAIVYAIFLGAISSTLMAVNPSGRMFDQKVGELRDYIRWKDLSKETEDRLLTYYETKYRGKYFEEDALLDDLNDSLKAEILLQNTRRLIMNVPFLKRSACDGRDELFMGRIAVALHSRNFIPGDFVTKQGDSGTDMYFILNGRAEVYVNDWHAVTLGAGAYFGEVALITKTLRTATVQAVLPSLMYRLTYTDFHKILADFADMRIRIDMLADERDKVLKMADQHR
ncbi:Potassium voltage-gated channel sub H member 7 [Chytriomyces hyalinus]|nr:Potassium voltage-gated channel sub H member 7 [Chytriomyces hyalinus]